MKSIPRSPLCGLLILLLVAGCGGDSSSDGSGSATAENTNGLTAEQMEKGVGPITSVSLGAIDTDLATRGGEIFTMKCTACHKHDERYVGPPLAGVTERRAPEFIMNMILNPDGMVQNHPEVRALLAEFMTPMPNQQLSEDEARAVLEYLRVADSGPQGAP